MRVVGEVFSADKIIIEHRAIFPRAAVRLRRVPRARPKRANGEENWQKAIGIDARSPLRELNALEPSGRPAPLGINSRIGATVPHVR